MAGLKMYLFFSQSQCSKNVTQPVHGLQYDGRASASSSVVVSFAQGGGTYLICIFYLHL